MIDIRTQGSLELISMMPEIKKFGRSGFFFPFVVGCKLGCLQGIE